MMQVSNITSRILYIILRNWLSLHELSEGVGHHTVVCNCETPCCSIFPMSSNRILAINNRNLWMSLWHVSEIHWCMSLVTEKCDICDVTISMDIYVIYIYHMSHFSVTYGTMCGWLGRGVHIILYHLCIQYVPYVYLNVLFLCVWFRFNGLLRGIWMSKYIFHWFCFHFATYRCIVHLYMPSTIDFWFLQT